MLLAPDCSIGFQPVWEPHADFLYLNPILDQTHLIVS
jgi:hypothetical protein